MIKILKSHKINYVTTGELQQSARPLGSLKLVSVVAHDGRPYRGKT